jgi:uncharacterized ferredoxin-like protein
MPIRPPIEEETVERLNKVIDGSMAVDPESVGVDKRLNVLIDQYNIEKHGERNPDWV